MSLLCWAQSAASSDSQSEPPPILDRSASLVEIVSKDAEDKGRVSAGTPVSRRITFRNISISPVRVELRQKSCGCLTPVIEPSRIEPGQSGTLTFGVSAAAAPGQHAYSVTLKVIEEIEGNDHRVQDIHASLRHTSSFTCVVRPRRLTLTVVQGTRLEVPLFVQSLISAEVKPDDCSVSSNVLRVGTDADPLTKDDTSVVWRVMLNGSLTEFGLIEETVRIADAGVAAAIAEVPTTIRVLPQWKASPPGIAVDWSELPASSVDYRLQLRNRAAQGRLEFISGVEQGKGVTARLDRTDPDRMFLVVSLSPNEVRPPFTTHIRLVDETARVVGEVPVAVYQRTEQ